MIDRKEDNQFHLVSKYEPSGDQPQAIEALVDNIEGGEKAQILKGATGTGKTYTMSQVIQRVNKPTLVIAHNKTLAGQLYGEFKEFFPDNAVEYFVSYYDFYQPEAYVPSSDTYIEKDSSVNDEIDKLRHSATSALLERNDVNNTLFFITLFFCFFFYFIFLFTIKEILNLEFNTINNSAFFHISI